MTTTGCTITAHNCNSTANKTRTGIWSLGRNFDALKQALSQKRAFAVQDGPGLEDKSIYVALQASQSSAFDTNWWMGSILPNRNAWTLTVFAKNFNDTGTLKISRITLHDDDGYGATALKSYLDSTYPATKVMVFGDWNDDVDTSITSGKASPYKNFVDDSADYSFPTKALSDARIATTASYPDAIDHQLITHELKAYYVSGSAQAYRVDSYISNHGNTTTDHFPVLSRYNW